MDGHPLDKLIASPGRDLNPFAKSEAHLESSGSKMQIFEDRPIAMVS